MEAGAQVDKESSFGRTAEDFAREADMSFGSENGIGICCFLGGLFVVFFGCFFVDFLGELIVFLLVCCLFVLVFFWECF